MLRSRHTIKTHTTNNDSWSSMRMIMVLCVSISFTIPSINAFTAKSSTSPSTTISTRSNGNDKYQRLFSTALTSPSPDESTYAMNIVPNDNNSNDQFKNNAGLVSSIKGKQRLEYIRQEGGRFSFNTKYGALNPFAIYYGVTSILLGLPWFVALTMYQFFQVITFGKFDKLRRIPIHLNQLWGESLMALTRCFPEIIHRDVLQNFYKTYVSLLTVIAGTILGDFQLETHQANCLLVLLLHIQWKILYVAYHFSIYFSLSLLFLLLYITCRGRPAMFVANHNSWMDIPFIGYTIGWRNYKLISKAELSRVPILGKAIRVGGHILVSRDDPRSQIKTLKQGMQSLKDGVHLCTFPEGTRARDGRLSKFKNGAFKMAHKVGAPIIPISIVAADHVMPIHWMFPYRPARGVAKVVVHEPIESVGKTEDELATEVRNAIITGLPPEQRPLDNKKE
jgi:1-acyl-sn-glycerol-3-phosphate acyltransferase